MMSADARLSGYLNANGHDATLVARDYQAGLPDVQILAIARSENRVLITDDRDFGDLVFRYHEAHAGVIFFRLRDTLFSTRVRRFAETLERYGDRLDEFIVVTDKRERPRRQ